MEQGSKNYTEMYNLWGWKKGQIVPVGINNELYEVIWTDRNIWHRLLNILKIGMPITCKIRPVSVIKKQSNKNLLNRIQEIIKEIEVYNPVPSDGKYGYEIGSIFLAIVNMTEIVENLNDKQEAAEKYIKSKYPKVYKEVYGEKNK